MNFKKLRNIFSNTLAVQIIFVVIIAGAIFVFERFSSKEDSVFKNVPKNETALLIDFDNMKRVFKGEVTEKMTVLDTLNASVAAGQIKIIYTVDQDNNTTVIEINDHVATDDKSFYFSVNERKIDTKDLNKIFVNPGDRITVRLE
ncbi:MAG: hypothetical protein A2655_03230 [Candidatus Yanofskybacteria bacterium RIFCSPHIGHO2_01_FULL_43_42]|uniref:Uncharacterized protein n=1 Tax=Candidatus Yanofskybacteria bacterium RIFCSPLOWO2_01_FULL_43_22 TaxID=1802695 RepID=A0A1F8GHJ8_9BACT|nr:MAG: hypothetical protein A2655_03230 [Candidatus Yanofskybacteria bacterium RIFCSPHIGHO2_01_FULL_43_42]OGN13010.1 MAG: hypothetical protein A3D48_03890 [Candidatus Yanofskybacteria bacterium RIFCSPHIGHO2_02_FULL_43_17]OGN23909.1 MAG: hypothetical protein A3A13_02365 [Candidatus Yanofskybacteria bacterium RIFCSPLOWO2_01_FULL_43_22]